MSEDPATAPIGGFPADRLPGVGAAGVSGGLHGPI